MYYKMFLKPFKFNYFNVNLIISASRHAVVEDFSAENVNVMINKMGFTKEEAAKFILRNRAIRNVETPDLIESYNFCKKINFSKEDLLQYPSLLRTHPVEKFHHYECLLDIGCKSIKPNLLSRTRVYYRSKIKKLKKDGFLEDKINVADRFLNILNPPILIPEEIQSSELVTIDEMCLSELHRMVLMKWLRVRLKATDDEILTLLRVHKMIHYKSFRIIDQNIQFAESLGFSRERIVGCGFLLHNYPIYPQTMLKEHPNLAGINTRDLYIKNPKTIMVNPRKLLEIYNILKNYNVPDKVIRERTSIFALSPYTIKHRLDQVSKNPDLKPLMNDPRMMILILSHNRISNRLSFLKSLKLKCVSLKHLSSIANQQFHDFLQENRDINGRTDVYTYFSSLLDEPRKNVKRQLTNHPFFCCIPFCDINETYFYLIEIGYTKKDLSKCILILLYSKDKIQEQITFMKEKWPNYHQLSSYKQLNLMLYHIEKNYHFTGNGVWRSADSHMKPIEERTLE